MNYKSEILITILEICCFTFIIFFSYKTIQFNTYDYNYNFKNIDSYLDEDGTLFLHNQSNNNDKIKILIPNNSLTKNNIIYFNNNYIKIDENNEESKILLEEVNLKPYETKKILASVINNNNNDILKMIELEYDNEL